MRPNRKGAAPRSTAPANPRRDAICPTPGSYWFGQFSDRLRRIYVSQEEGSLLAMRKWRDVVGANHGRKRSGTRPTAHGPRAAFLHLEKRAGADSARSRQPSSRYSGTPSARDRLSAASHAAGEGRLPVCAQRSSVDPAPRATRISRLATPFFALHYTCRPYPPCGQPAIVARVTG